MKAWLVVLLALTGCPSKSEQPPAPPAACKEFGAQCEYAPGKLGSCVVRENCTGTGCLVCQSQH